MATYTSLGEQDPQDGIIDFNPLAENYPPVPPLTDAERQTLTDNSHDPDNDFERVSHARATARALQPEVIEKTRLVDEMLFAPRSDAQIAEDEKQEERERSNKKGRASLVYGLAKYDLPDLETYADTDNAKAAVKSADKAAKEAAKEIPVLLQNFKIISSKDLQVKFPDPPEPVLEGIIGRGEKLILGGSSKAGKTYSLLNLASAITTGGKWLGHKCRKGRVLFLNFEVSDARMAERNRLLEGAGVDMAGVDFLNLRGAQFDWATLIEALEYSAQRMSYDLLILDPVYKLLAGMEENNNTEVARGLAEVERIAVETGAAVAFAHHFSKGNKAEVTAMDRLSGAGAFARDPDAILTLTEHEEDNCFTLEATVRNFATPKSVVVEYTFPRFTEREELDSAKLKQTKRGGGHNKRGGADTVVEVLGIGGPMLSAALQKALMDRARVSDRTARRWMKEAFDSGAVEDTQGLWKVSEK
ncbi:helicase RepA family protein [Verrucomicrobiales bacterium]|nr:helicase RepA family protein [Verrucomicrobiales bacterium]